MVIENMSKDGRFIKSSHRFVYFLIRVLSFLYTRIFLGFRSGDRFKIKRNEPVLVLSNHQTDADPFCILPGFNAPVYPIATDSIFAGRFRNRLFSYLSVIPKKKGATDARTVIKMYEYLKKGASVLLFPEGNRSYAEFQYYIAPDLARLIKRTHATVVIYNIHGGSGISPRFKNKNRRGRFWGEIRTVLTYEQYSQMDDNDLFLLVKDNLRVFDSDSKEKYKSSKRAEFLERMLFWCPACGRFETLQSSGAVLQCTACGMRAEYTEDLHLRGPEGYDRLVDWWNHQKAAVRDLSVVPEQPIFRDDCVKLMQTDPFGVRKELDCGELILTDSTLRCGKTEIKTAGITSASIVSGRNLTFVYENNDYTLRGDKRFCPVKYIFALNRIDTAMHKTGADKYFNLED